MVCIWSGSNPAQSNFSWRLLKKKHNVWFTFNVFSILTDILREGVNLLYGKMNTNIAVHNKYHSLVIASKIAPKLLNMQGLLEICDGLNKYATASRNNERQGIRFWVILIYKSLPSHHSTSDCIDVARRKSKRYQSILELYVKSNGWNVTVSLYTQRLHEMCTGFT